MKSKRNTYHDDKPLMLGSADTVNAIDIIQQTAQVDMQRRFGKACETYNG